MDCPRLGEESSKAAITANGCSINSVTNTNVRKLEVIMAAQVDEDAVPFDALRLRFSRLMIRFRFCRQSHVQFVWRAKFISPTQMLAAILGTRERSRLHLNLFAIANHKNSPVYVFVDNVLRQNGVR